VPEPGYSRAALAAFELFFLPWMRRRLHAVHIAWPAPNTIPHDHPLLLAANHVSWWDGFLLREVHRRLRPGAPIQVLMTEAELARLRFFRRFGAVGVDPERTASVLGAVRRIKRQAEARPDTMVFVFPQGRIYPSSRRPLGFRRGVELIARQLDAVVLPVGIHIEPLNHAAATAFIAIGEPMPPGSVLTAEAMEARVEGELDRIRGLLEQHGEAVAEHWPPREPPAPAALRRAPRGGAQVVERG
jgi:1-acyl-sn-glycerol-3-phosphate acyltransferase